jgi:hypothetical protein
MDDAIAFFKEQAISTKPREQRLMLEHLCDIAKATQQNTRMLDVLKAEVEQLHIALGVR